MQRRVVLSALGSVVAASTGGCLGADHSSSEPAYDRVVTLANSSPEVRTVEVTVTHDGSAGGVHRERYRIEPGAEIEVYDFREAPTDGVETYEIAGELASGRRAVIEYRTNRCVSHPEIIVRSERRIDGTWAEC